MYEERGVVSDVVSWYGVGRCDDPELLDSYLRITQRGCNTVSEKASYHRSVDLTAVPKLLCRERSRRNMVRRIICAL